MPNSGPDASAMASLDTMEASTSLPPAFAWSHAYSFATSVANFFAMPALPDAAAETSSDADDDNETLGGGNTAFCVATGAAGATTVKERPGPNCCGTVARIVWPDDGTLTSNCDPGGLSGGHVTLTRWTGSAAGTRMVDLLRVERLERAVDLGCCGAHFKELRRPLNYYL